MTTKLYIKSIQEHDYTLSLIKKAISAEINKFEMAMDLANQRLVSYENKYHVTSEHFISDMTAEDLNGGDDEYVSWAGEYRLKQRLEKKLSGLKSIEYEN